MKVIQDYEKSMKEMEIMKETQTINEETTKETKNQ
jgi:hypothetical protein